MHTPMQTQQDWLNQAPTLFVESDGRCEKFFANFFRSNRHFVLRATGGCGSLEKQYYAGLRHLYQALAGPSIEQPRFSGFCLFGGTRMILKDSPTKIKPGITEVFPALKKNCPNARILGIVAKAGNLKTTAHGIIVSDESGKDFATIIHPEQHSVLLIQSNADQKADWNAEWQRCLEICEAQAANNWQGLLLVYNGGQVSERELLCWAELGRENSFYRVLLVNNSGGIAEKYSGESAFLAAHPNVHVCDNEVNSMRSKLFELGAIV